MGASELLKVLSIGLNQDGRIYYTAMKEVRTRMDSSLSSDETSLGGT